MNKNKVTKAASVLLITAALLGGSTTAANAALKQPSVYDSVTTTKSAPVTSSTDCGICWWKF